MFAFCKDELEANRSKLSFTARIITKYSLERFLSTCGEKLSKGFLKFCKFISNLILGQIIVSNHKIASLQTLQPSYASVNSTCAQPPPPPSPPGQLRGICPPCARRWGICKCCAARGPSICQPPGRFPSF